MPDQRLLNRYGRRLNRGSGSLDRLANAIHTLLQGGGARDPFFLARSLELLATHLGAAQVTLAMVSGGVVETRWWHPEAEEEPPPAPVRSFCEWLLDHPERTLVIRDMATGPHLEHLAGLPPPLRAQIHTFGPNVQGAASDGSFTH